MIRFRKYLLTVAALAALLGAPTLARADYAVRVIDDGVVFNDTNHGGTIGVLVMGNSLTFTGSTTHFSITNGSGLSNNPGGLSTSNLDLSNNEQVNATFGSTGGMHTITIQVSQTGWTSPNVTPLMLMSSAGGSIGNVAGTNPAAKTSVASTYQGFLDNTDTLFGMPVAGSTPLQSASQIKTGVGTAPLVFSPAEAVNMVPAGTPFSLTDVLTFTFTLDPGSGQDTANVSASTVAAVVPVPAGVILALTGLPVLGAGAWLRRRRKTV
jgi:hypothetical protein